MAGHYGRFNWPRLIVCSLLAGENLRLHPFCFVSFVVGFSLSPLPFHFS